MMSILCQRSVPYLAAALLAACGWGIKYTLDKLTAESSVSYCVELYPEEAVRLTIENLSTVSFTNLTFSLQSPDGTFANPEIEAVPPAHYRGAPPTITPNRTVVIYDIPLLNPRDRFIGSAHFTGRSKPTLLLSSSTLQPRLRECSLLTILLRHRLAVIAGFVVLAAGAFVSMMYYCGRTNDNSHQGTESD